MSNTKPRQDIHTSGVPLICQSCEARHKGVCGALSPEQLTQLARHTKRSAVRRSENLVAAGEPFEQYSNIIGGVVKLTKLMADGREQIVSLQFAPDFLGRPFAESSDYSAESTTDVRLCSFPKSVLERMIKQSPELEHRLYQQSLKELDEARDWMLTLGRKTAGEKVASFLCLIADHIDPEAEANENVQEFRLPLTRTEMAEFLGLTIETVSRHITKLKKAGLIELIDTKTVKILSVARLKQAAGNL